MQHVGRAEWDDDVADVIINDMARRPRPRGQIIVVANEKGGVGKSTVAFQLAVALADRGHRVAAIDMDSRQRSFANALSHREATARRLDVALPQPQHAVLLQPTGAMLMQEMARLGWDSDYFIIDAPGHVGGVVRRAMAIADHLVTPVYGSFVDLDLLARLHPVTRAMMGPGCFAALVADLSAARQQNGGSGIAWTVFQNRIRRGNSHNQRDIDTALAGMAGTLGFTLGPAWSDRVAYRELFLLGLSHRDLGRIPALGRTRARTDDCLDWLVTRVEAAAPVTTPMPLVDLCAA